MSNHFPDVVRAIRATLDEFCSQTRDHDRTEPHRPGRDRRLTRPETRPAPTR